MESGLANKSPIPNGQQFRSAHFFLVCLWALLMLVVQVRSLSDGSISRSWEPVVERPSDAYSPYLLALYDAYLEKNPVSLCLVRPPPPRPHYA